MTKLRLLLLLLIVIMLVIAAYFMQSTRAPFPHSEQKNRPQHPEAKLKEVTPLPSPAEVTPPPMKDGRKVIGIIPGREKEALKDLKIVNTISADWEDKLVENLKLQGGESLKDIQIKRVESLIMRRDGNAINTESVIISLKNEEGEVSKFRAMIDSQTGKILETWDRPVVDPINPREDFRLKIDPRYHSDN